MGADPQPFLPRRQEALGCLAIGLFLSLNVFRLEVDPIESVQIIMRLAENQIGEKALAEWIQRHLVRQKKASIKTAVDNERQPAYFTSRCRRSKTTHSPAMITKTNTLPSGPTDPPLSQGEP